MKNRVAGFALFLLLASVLAQTAPNQGRRDAPPDVGAIEVVPIDKEPSHHLVFENEYVRVFSVEVASHSETKYHQHDRDYVWVSLGDSDVESVRVGATAVSVKPKDGETQFSKGGFAHKAVNKSDQRFKNVTVELKGKRFNPTPCASNNDECTNLWQHPGLAPRTNDVRQELFSDGQNLKAERFELMEAESAVSVPFIENHLESKVLLIPVTLLTAHIVNARIIYRPRDMKPGEVMWAECSPEVAVLEGKGKREWVVLRFIGPDRPSCTPRSPCTPACQGPSRQEKGARDDKAKGAAKK